MVIAREIYALVHRILDDFHILVQMASTRKVQRQFTESLGVIAIQSIIMVSASEVGASFVQEDHLLEVPTLRSISYCALVPV